MRKLLLAWSLAGLVCFIVPCRADDLSDLDAIKTGVIRDANPAKPGSLRRWADWQAGLAERLQVRIEADLENVLRLAPDDRVALSAVLNDLEAASPYLDCVFLERISEKMAVVKDKEALAVCEYLVGNSLLNTKDRLIATAGINEFAFVYRLPEDGILANAEKRFRSALSDVSPESEYASKMAAGLVACLLRRGDAERALREMDAMEKLLASNKHGDLLFLEWAKIRRDFGEKAKAVKLCEIVIARSPGSRDAEMAKRTLAAVGGRR